MLCGPPGDSTGDAVAGPLSIPEGLVIGLIGEGMAPAPISSSGAGLADAGGVTVRSDRDPRGAFGVGAGAAGLGARVSFALPLLMLPVFPFAVSNEDMSGAAMGGTRLPALAAGEPAPFLSGFGQPSGGSGALFSPDPLSPVRSLSCAAAGPGSVSEGSSSDGVAGGVGLEATGSLRMKSL